MIMRARRSVAPRAHAHRVRSLGQRVDSLRQVEIEFGQTAFAVGGKNEAHFVVTDIDVGMMLLFLRHFRDRIHKIDRLGEVIELKRALDMFLLELPFRDFFQARLSASSALIKSAITGNE